MERNISLVSTTPEVSTTLRRYVGELISDNQLDDALQAKLGDTVHFLAAAELYGVMPNWPALRMRDFGGRVLVRYAGMTSELSIADERRRHLASLKTIVGAVACFDVVQAQEVVGDLSHYPEGVSSALITRQVGVSVDYRMQLHSLADGLRLAEQQASVPDRPELTVVR